MQTTSNSIVLDDFCCGFVNCGDDCCCYCYCFCHHHYHYVFSTSGPVSSTNSVMTDLL